MKYLVLLVPFFVPALVHAHVPVLVEQTSLHDVYVIDDPTLSQAFYGTQNGFPHTYEIRTKEPFLLRAEVLIPDIDHATENVTGIIIKETGRQGRVEEVARMLATDATWESFYEFWGGDSYRRGGVFEREVPAGVYRIEVSTPDNESPYVLVVGTREEWGDLGYFDIVGRIADVKVFFGKSKLRVIESPLVYIPLLIMACIGGVYWYRRRMKQG
jgi:hypothetical protein